MSTEYNRKETDEWNRSDCVQLRLLQSMYRFFDTHTGNISMSTDIFVNDTVDIHSNFFEVTTNKQ
jgi:hypothetical protein